jgi:phenylacetate-CoA ligase
MMMQSPDYHILDEASRQRLHELIDQPCSPLFKNSSGHRLEVAEIAELDRFTRKDAETAISAKLADNDWIEAFVDDCLAQVPFYRQYSRHIASFDELPSICRADLSRDITQFVPDHLPIDRLIAYKTSGTTGHPLIVPSHPVVAAKYSCFHKKALTWNGIDCGELQSELAIMLAGYQENCFTYASISPYLNNKGLVKLNFHPRDWSHPDDRQRYLDRTQPDLISGDPISLTELGKLDFNHRPKAVLTTSMTLLNGCRSELQNRFACPVIDVYSLNETGPIGCSVAGKQGYKLLQPELLIEILDMSGKPVTPGQRGEITVTSGFNHYLPLLRYRTGDFGRLELDGRDWYLTELEGRSPVQFRTGKGEWLNNVDITHLLNPFALPQFSLHQHSDGRLVLEMPSIKYADEVRRLLNEKLGYPVECQQLDDTSSEHKIVQYSSDLNGGLIA